MDALALIYDWTIATDLCIFAALSLAYFVLLNILS